MTKVPVFFTFLTVAIIGIMLYSMYYSAPIESVKPEIQTFLNTKYNNQFTITHIEKNHTGLFFRVAGYKIDIIDSLGIELKGIAIEYQSSENKWTTIMGSNIERQYKDEKKKRDQ